ncbi:winged helix-turn-helix domain-containing protein [Fodinicurvata sediminis]|uniref:winged helix-turn-helix domain-containing protein n=1 Tax=Fodinicurvata sediminis TaxID=1121832 RepID=UPI0003B518B9|nr:LysR family transcriptional regulator [Fodinicurvata sediminis]
MKAGNKITGARLRIVLAPDVALGPGKADILEAIRDTGSIAAAGRRLGMSYRRAWHLVESLNACFREPLVETHRGGKSRGGASLSETGQHVLTSYRRMERLTHAAIAEELDGLRNELLEEAEGK